MIFISVTDTYNEYIFYNVYIGIKLPEIVIYREIFVPYCEILKFESKPCAIYLVLKQLLFFCSSI